MPPKPTKPSKDAVVLAAADADALPAEAEAHGFSVEAV